MIGVYWASLLAWRYCRWNAKRNSHRQDTLKALKIAYFDKKNTRRQKCSFWEYPVHKKAGHSRPALH
jgi:hypothetical protein